MRFIFFDITVVEKLYIADSSLKKLRFICSFMVEREVCDKNTIAKELCNIYITIIENLFVEFLIFKYESGLIISTETLSCFKSF